MQFATLDLSFTNSALLPLKAKQTGDEKYINVPNKALPATMRAQLASIYKALTGEELAEDNCTLRAGCRDGKPSRLFGPAFYLLEGGVPAIRWGNSHIELKLTKSGAELAKPTEASEAEQISLTFGSAKVGQYDEAVLIVLISLDDEELTLNVPIKPAKYEVPVDASAISGYLRRGQFDNAMANIAILKQNGESSASSLPMLDISSSFKPIEHYSAEGELIEANADAVYKVLSAKPIKTSWGNSHRLVVETPEGETVTAWSAKPISNMIHAGILFPFSFTFSRQIRKDGKQRLNFEFPNAQFEQNDATLSLDW